jgi:hypothetical protein
VQLLPRALVARRASGHYQRQFIWVGLALVIVGMPALGFLANSHALYAVAGGAMILFLGLLLIDVRFIPILATPATLLVVRAGGGSGLSASDLVLFLATACALTVFQLREAPEIRKLLWVLCFYQATTVLAVVDNPYRANIIEWIHEAFLVGGSLIVGWVVGRAGRARPAVAVFLLGSCFIGLWACLQTATHHFQPAYLPGGMQKNYIGDMLCFAVILAYARPAWCRFRTLRWPRAAIVICLLGILSAQSKQAMISCAVAIVFMAIRDRGLGRRSRVLLLSLVPIMVIAYETVSHEFVSNNRFNSVHQRQTWFKLSVQVWHTSPVVGVGFRWWYTNRFSADFQPPNGVFEMLTSAGVIGLVGFIVLTFGALVILWQVPRPLGTLAVAVLVARFIQGELDIFWVGAEGSIPWLISGLVLGVAALQRSVRPSRTAETDPAAMLALPLQAGALAGQT